MPSSVPVTFFADHAARAMREETLALADLAHLIAKMIAPEKARLPWLKLATFGTRRTDKNSLRHDGNVIAISGIELDYDGEFVTFEDAVKIAEEAGLAAVIYTSPSHTDDRPRWRVLCPTSAELPPQDRAHLVSRVNGLYCGIFASESWTLSQAYYYGAVAANAERAHRVEVVDGTPIDLLDELDQVARGKPNGSAGAGANGALGEPFAEEAVAAEIISGSSYHTASVRLVGKWAQSGIAFLDAQRKLEALFDQVFPPDRDQRWHDRRADISRIIRDIYGKDARGSDEREQDKARGDRPPHEKAVSPDDFYAYMPMHNYIYAPTMAAWPAASVNSRIPPIRLTNGAGEPVLDNNGKPVILSAGAWLDRNRPVEQMTWAPGLPTTIPDKLVLEGGWIDRPGVTCLNLYRAPTIVPGDPTKAERWVELLHYLYSADADHLINWLAHRVQRPSEKINHALVLGGRPGIGKDTLIEPVKHAIGPWNFQEVSPVQVLGRFNGFLKTVILRISEARDLGEFDRFQFYDHMKAYTAAPPDTLRVDEKHLREYAIVNCCGVVITTNHKTDGIFLPPDDRRHYVAWSDRTKDESRFQDGYWADLYAYYENGGSRHVTAFLMQRDISGFDAKAPPLKTPAFWVIADANRAPEEPELADVLDQLGNPAVVTLSRIQGIAEGEFAEWIRDRRNRRIIPHRLEKCGYIPVRNPYAEDGLWKILGKRQAIYARNSLTLRDQITAVRELAGQSGQ